MFRTIQEAGYTFDVVDQPASGSLAFCGDPAPTTPLCPNCTLPLFQLLRLDTSDPRWNLGKLATPHIDLVYCWRCNVAQGPFYYRVEDVGSIKVLQYRLGNQGPDFPYPDYPLSFPRLQVLPKPFDPAIQEAVATVNELERRGEDGADFKFSFADWQTIFDLRHQIGGEPFLQEPHCDLRCVSCKEQMPFLAAIADANADPRGFAGNCGVQMLFFVCLDCSVVGAVHEVD